MKILGGDGVPKGEITDAPKGTPDIRMTRHNRRKFIKKQLSRAARKALAESKRI